MDFDHKMSNSLIITVRYDQAPPHRIPKYPSQNLQGPQGPQGGPQGPSTHMQGPPNHHQQPQQQPNFNNSYPNSVPQIQHQQSNYYGPQGRQIIWNTK